MSLLQRTEEDGDQNVRETDAVSLGEAIPSPTTAACAAPRRQGCLGQESPRLWVHIPVTSWQGRGANWHKPAASVAMLPVSGAQTHQQPQPPVSVQDYGSRTQAEPQQDKGNKHWIKVTSF